MNIVEWCFVAGVAIMLLFPFLSYYNQTKSFKGVILDNGHAYYNVFLLNFKTRPVDVSAMICLLFFFGSAMPKLGFALAVYFFIVTFCIHRFLRWHEQNQPVTVDH